MKKTKEDTDSLFSDLSVKPDPDPRCSKVSIKRDIFPRSSTSRSSKRSLISGLSGLAGDVGKLLSFATKVVDNLVQAVEKPVPPISEIETLTDTLKEIADDLEKDEKKPSNSLSQSQLTSTSQQSSSKLSSTGFTSSSTATSTGEIVCATGCSACASPILKGGRALMRRDLLQERSLDDPADFDSINQYFMEQSKFLPQFLRGSFHRSGGFGAVPHRADRFS